MMTKNQTADLLDRASAESHPFQNETPYATDARARRLFALVVDLSNALAVSDATLTAERSNFNAATVQYARQVRSLEKELERLRETSTVRAPYGPPA